VGIKLLPRASAANGRPFLRGRGHSSHTRPSRFHAGGGVDRAAAFVAPQGASSGLVCLANAPVTGDRSSGTFSCAITIPATAAGEWQVVTVDVRDFAGNSLGLRAAALVAAGFPVTIKVTR
jgi:hypothetical protein